MEWIEEVSEFRDGLRNRLPAFFSPHEGFAYVQDGVSRLQKAVFDGGTKIDLQTAAVEVAAQAVRFLEDLCE